MTKLIVAAVVCLCLHCQAAGIALLEPAANPGYRLEIHRGLAQWLTAQKLANKTLSFSEIEHGGLKPDSVQCLLIADSRFVTAGALPGLLAYLKHGGDIVLLGGKPFSQVIQPNGAVQERYLQADRDGTPTEDFPAFYYEQLAFYQLKDVTGVTLHPGQKIFPQPVNIPGAFTGLSALASGSKDESLYYPVLGAVDRYGRSQGHAAGILANFDGKYRNGQWLLSGIEQPAFYESPDFRKFLLFFLQNAPAKKFSEMARAENRQSQAHRVAPVPAQPAFIEKAPAGRRLMRNGRPLFLLGCNYLGPYDRTQSDNQDPDFGKIEADFRLASSVGINAFRFWFGASFYKSESNLQQLTALARKYDIGLLLYNPGANVYLQPGAEVRDTVKDLVQVAARLQAEPAVLGYDLRNEVYLSEVIHLKHNGARMPAFLPGDDPLLQGRYDAAKVEKNIANKTAADRYLPKGLSQDELRHILPLLNVYARKIRPTLLQNTNLSSSSLPVAPGVIRYTGEYKELLQRVNDTFAIVITNSVNAIRAVDSRHLITLGYNTENTLWEANRNLDFFSHHIYVHQPKSFDDVKMGCTAIARLAQTWPNHPITIGEFGYGTGNTVGGKLLDENTACVWEFMQYLFAYAHACNGVFKWTLYDKPMPLFYKGWSKTWFTKVEDRQREAGFGFFYYNGAGAFAPKGIALSIRFLADYLKQTQAPAAPGSFRFLEGATPLAGGYEFNNADARFVGAARYTSDLLSFNHPGPVNVLLTWGPASLRLMAADDCTVTLQPDRLNPNFKPAAAVLTGKCGPVERHQALTIALLKGETVDLTFPK